MEVYCLRQQLSDKQNLKHPSLYQLNSFFCSSVLFNVIFTSRYIFQFVWSAEFWVSNLNREWTLLHFHLKIMFNGTVIKNVSQILIISLLVLAAITFNLSLLRYIVVWGQQFNQFCYAVNNVDCFYFFFHLGMFKFVYNLTKIIEFMTLFYNEIVFQWKQLNSSSFLYTRSVCPCLFVRKMSFQTILHFRGLYNPISFTSPH